MASGKYKQDRRIDRPSNQSLGSSTTPGDNGGGISVPPVSPPTVPVPFDLAVSSALVNSAVTPTARLDVTWHGYEAYDLERYKIQVSTTSDFSANVETFTTGVNADSASIDGRHTSTTYYVRIAAVVGSTQSDWSSVVSETTPADITAPNPPTSCTAAFIGIGDLRLACTNPTSANFKWIEARIYADATKATLWDTVYFSTGEYIWSAAQNRLRTAGACDPSVYVEFEAVSYGNVHSTTVSATATKAAPTAPTVSTDFTGADLIFTISYPTDAASLTITLDGIPRTIAPVTRYVYTFSSNAAEHSGVADPSIAYSVTATDGLSQSSSATSGTATNAAPSAPASVNVSGFFSTFSIAVTATEPIDFSTYRYRIIQTAPSAADVVYDNRATLQVRAVDTQATYQVGVKVVDVFGQESTETLSSIVTLDALTLADLRNSVGYTDSESTAAATLKAALSDDNRASGGISYALNAGWARWIRADWQLLQRIRTITLSMTPASGTSKWYIRLSKDGSTWSYFSGPVNTTGSTGQSTSLTSVANAAAAQSAAITSTTLGNSTANRVDLPSLQEARYIEAWIQNTTAATRVDEFYPRRLTQSDDGEFENVKTINLGAGAVTADRMSVAQLSAITAQMGTLNMDGVITIATTGGIYQGSGAFGAPTTGLKIYNSGGIGKLSTYNSGTEQITLDTDGKLKAGAGDVVLDAFGLTLYYGSGSPVVRFKDSSTDVGYLSGNAVGGFTSTVSLTTATTTPRGDLSFVAQGSSLKDTNLYLSASNTNQWIAMYATSGTFQGLHVGGNGAAPTAMLQVDGSGDFSGGLNVGAASGATAGQILATITDAATASVSDPLIIGHNSSGTAAANFGTGISFLAESSTTNDQNVGRIVSRWTVASHASRRSEMVFFVYDATTTRAPLTLGTTGAASAIGFFGATPVARPTVTGAKGGNAALTSLLTQLANLGLIADSTT